MEGVKGRGWGLWAGGWGLWMAFALVLLLRIPFWNQAIQGDDTIYLHEAAHALVEPLHPDNTKYVFQGALVDLRGHPHGPMNAWVLAGLLAVFGEVKEIPFHAAYTVFSLIAAWAMWSLARRFSPRPLCATLLFLAVPVFVVNGNSLETDLPFLAFWMAAMALFHQHRPLACIFLALAAMTASIPQAFLLTPILGVWVWLYRRHDRTAWLAIFVPPVTLVAWQLFERFSTGSLPAGVLTGYLTRFDLWNPKARLALLMHFCFLIFPALLPGAFAIAWRKRREPDTLFLLAWIGIFFSGVLAVFFAGSARYLLPIAAPVALIASRLKPKWLAAGFAAQMTLGLGLAVANYQHWDGYRKVAADLRERAQRQRVWVDDEWGLRHYLQSAGALPLTKTQRLRSGDIVVSSELSRQVEVNAPLLPIASTIEIRPTIPLRLIGLNSHSAYSTVSKGIWPFGISSGPVDRVRVVEVGERHPTLEYLTMTEPAAREHVVAGIWPDDQWMSRSGIVVLKSPAAPKPLSATFYIPDNAPARHVWLLLDGQEVASQTFTAPGKYHLASTVAVKSAGPVATVEIRVDRTFTAPPDIRDLGMVLIAVGFK
jgi:hypothetical protein